MKTVLSFLAFLAVSIICSDDALGQAYMQEHLPEGARARIGKGSVYGLAFSPDNTQIAAAKEVMMAPSSCGI